MFYSLGQNDITPAAVASTIIDIPEGSLRRVWESRIQGKGINEIALFATSATAIASEIAKLAALTEKGLPLTVSRANRLQLLLVNYKIGLEILMGYYGDAFASPHAKMTLGEDYDKMLRAKASLDRSMSILAPYIETGAVLPPDTVVSDGVPAAAPGRIPGGLIAAGVAAVVAFFALR